MPWCNSVSAARPVIGSACSDSPEAKLLGQHSPDLLHLISLFIIYLSFI